MGFNVDLIAIDRLPAGEILRRFGFLSSSKTEEDPESPVVSAQLPSGWYILYFNDHSIPSESELATISTDADVMLLSVCETVMTSLAVCWTNGIQKWRIAYDCKRSHDNLVAVGDLPDCYQSIVVRLNELQVAKHDADYNFDIPVEMFHEIAGFRYDGNPDGYSVETFFVLQRIKSPRKWWRLW